MRCHQKALSDIKQSVAVLRAVGYEVTEIPFRCFGMAGNFGYEAEHYEISQKIGQDWLMPTIAAHPGLPVVANGISCRKQVEHMTGRTPRHLVEFVADRI